MIVYAPPFSGSFFVSLSILVMIGLREGYQIFICFTNFMLAEISVKKSSYSQHAWLNVNGALPTIMNCILPLEAHPENNHGFTNVVSISLKCRGSSIICMVGGIKFHNRGPIIANELSFGWGELDVDIIWELALQHFPHMDKGISNSFSKNLRP